MKANHTAFAGALALSPCAGATTIKTSKGYGSLSPVNPADKR